MKKAFTVEFENTPFLRTSHTGPQMSDTELDPYRISSRCEVLFVRNPEAIKGKIILDLASHDGRLSYACLKLGAKHVTGVEGREYLVNHANDNLTQMGYSPEQFHFTQGDVFDYLEKVKPGEFDTILCCGFFYHTIRHVEMVREYQRIKPEYLLLDTLVERGRFVNIFNWLGLLTRIRLKHFRRMKSSRR